MGLAFHDPVAPAPAISRAFQLALQSWDGLLEWLPVGIYTCDAQGHLVNYNHRAAELWGHAPPIGDRQQRFCGAFKVYTAEGEPLPLSEAPMAELLSTGLPIRDRELQIEHPDGTRLTILANLDPLFDEDGALVGGVNCFQDITARRAAEARLEQREQWYRDLLEALPAAIYTTDADGRITFFNQAAADLAGRRPVLGQESWCVTWKLYAPDGSPIAHEDCPMATALKTGTPVRGTEKVALRPDGTRVPILPYPTPLHDADGKMIGAVNMLVDITERKQAEEQKIAAAAGAGPPRQQHLRRDPCHHPAKPARGVLTRNLRRGLHRPAPGARPGAQSSPCQGLVGRRSRRACQRPARAVLPRGRRSSQDRRPKVTLAPPQVIALGVVLHELGTNAAKYGALSVESGRVELCWLLHEDRVCLTWAERNGPPVVPPSRKGLGSKLIERGLPDAGIDWRFLPDGVVCMIELPLAEARTTNATAAQGTGAAASPAEAFPTAADGIFDSLTKVPIRA